MSGIALAIAVDAAAYSAGMIPCRCGAPAAVPFRCSPLTIELWGGPLAAVITTRSGLTLASRFGRSWWPAFVTSRTTTSSSR